MPPIQWADFLQGFQRYPGGIFEASLQNPSKSDWLRRERLWLLGLFAAALILRLYYLHALAQTPFFEPLSPTLDDGVYDLRGLEIAAGAWLGKPSWLVYTTPLYPYFLGLIYRIFGHSIGTAHLIQTCLGAFTPLLVYALAKKAFNSRRVPIIAGAMAAVYVPFIFYENMLLGESVSIFLMLCALRLLVRALGQADGALRAYFPAGLLFGITALLRPNITVPVISCAIFLGLYLASKKNSRGLGAAAALLLLAGHATGVSPITLKNYRLYKDFVPVAAHGGVNFYMGTNPQKGGGWHAAAGLGTGMKELVDNSVVVAERAQGRPLKPSEVSAYWTAKAFDNIRGSPWGFLKLLLRRTAYFLNRYEYPDTINMLFVAEFIPLLKLGAFAFGVVAVLAIGGLVFRRRQWSVAATLLAIFALCYAAPVGVIGVVSRYRVPIVPILIIFAASGLDCAWDCWLKRDRGRLLKFCALCALTSVLVFYPVRHLRFAVPYNALGIYFDQKGLWLKAENCYRKALEISPNFPDPYHNLFLLYRNLGDMEKALTFEQKYQMLKAAALAAGT